MKPIDQSFYTHHRGILINLVSILLFLLWRQEAAWEKAPEQSFWMAILFLVVFLLEPWALYYSVGVMNQRREALGIKAHWLQNKLVGTLGLIFWGGRISIYGAFIFTMIKKLVGPNWEEKEWLLIVVFILILIRESFNLVFMATKEPIKNYHFKYDLLADVVLLIVLFFGEIIVFEVFKEMGLTGFHSWKEIPSLLFPIGILSFVFYFPMRFIYTLEDLTFAKSSWDKVERIASFLIVFLSFLLLRS